jgi:hypothetical protein
MVNEVQQAMKVVALVACQARRKLGVEPGVAQDSLSPGRNVGR